MVKNIRLSEAEYQALLDRINELEAEVERLNTELEGELEYVKNLEKRIFDGT